MPSFNCLFCEKVGTNGEDIFKHMKEKHSCKNCNKYTNNCICYGKVGKRRVAADSMQTTNTLQGKAADKSETKVQDSSNLGGNGDEFNTQDDIFYSKCAEMIEHQQEAQNAPKADRKDVVLSNSEDKNQFLSQDDQYCSDVFYTMQEFLNAQNFQNLNFEDDSDCEELEVRRAKRAKSDDYEDSSCSTSTKKSISQSISKSAFSDIDMVLTSEDLENKYSTWLNSKKSWLCQNSSKLDDVLNYLSLGGINITPVEKNQIKAAENLTNQFAVTYNVILKAGVSKINTVIDVMGQTKQEDVKEAFLEFKEQNMPQGVVNKILTSMSFNEINEEYKKWIRSNVPYFCDNSSRLDEILTKMSSKKLLDTFQRRQIESAKGLTKQFSMLYEIIEQLGVEHLDSVIEIFSNSKQELLQDEFTKFRNQHSFKTTNAGRTTEDKPLVNMSKSKKIRVETIDDTIDFVHNMEPLEVVVRESMEYLDDDKMAYKMRSDPRGFALIINNIHFNDPERSRSGAAERDTQYTTALLQQLNYKVTLKEDVKLSEIKEIIHNFKQKFAHHDVDSCIVILMSHGSNNIFEMSDGPYIHIWQDVIYKFDNHNCPQLQGKPKIFIVQACQNFQEKGRTGTDSTSAVPEVSDMLICFSTIPGHVSRRDKYLGSWYIYCLTKVFMENSHNMEITKMLQKIALETMMNVKSEDDLLQVSTYQPILFKDFYFNPGL